MSVLVKETKNGECTEMNLYILHFLTLVLKEETHGKVATAPV